MLSDAKTADQYVEELPEDRKEPFNRLREALNRNLPPEFIETMQYRMIGYVVPHSIYPPGYYAKPEEPLPFISLANAKKHIALYHMGVYTKPELKEWFEKEYRSRTGEEPDMGKSCIRLKKIAAIPYDLIGKLAARMSAAEWIEIYEKTFRPK